MERKELKDFFLVGGTALSLHLGHRISVDIDLFTLKDFNTSNLLKDLTSEFQVQNVTEEKNTLNLDIKYPNDSQNIIKIDLITYAYELLNPIMIVDNIRLLSLNDIIPMKLSALSARGAKKDFYDIYYLLKEFTFEEMISFFVLKYPNANKLHLLKSLSYFDDAEFEPEPKLFDETNWSQVKSKISNIIDNYIKASKT